MAAVDPIRPTDEEARRLARSLTRTARFGSLATLTSEGRPFASLVSTATDSDGTPLILVSALSGHTGNLEGDGRCSLLLAPGGKGDPLAHPRISLVCDARAVERETPDGERVRRRFLAHQPKAALYADFPDFSFFRLDPLRASLNGGFGRAYALGAADLLTDLTGTETLLTEEAGSIAHMNEDHADAVALYATALLGGSPGAWRITGFDPDGADLAKGDESLRLVFPERVTETKALAALLIRLFEQAREAA